MNLKDFDLSALLSFKPEEGRLLLGTNRMLIFPQAALAFLQQILRDQLGQNVTHAVLSQFGYQCGFGDFSSLNAHFDWDSEADSLGCGPLMHCWEGIVAVEPVKMGFDREKGTFDFEGIWRNSYEAEISLNMFGVMDKPVCSTLTGYASGWCTAFFGKELLAVEHRCMGMGDPHCEWRVQPIEAWGDTANYWYDALQATNLSIAQNLELQVKKRTQQIEEMVLELKKNNLALTQLDQLKSEFLANVSHEVRTPLTLLLAPLQNILRSTKLSPQLRKQLERMSRNGLQLYGLVNQLLDFSKLEAGMMTLELESVNTHAVVTHLLEGALNEAEAKNIELRYHCPQIPPNLKLDQKKFEKIIVNLLRNSLKFTPNGGRISLSLEIDNGYLIFSVKDTGIGIAPSDHSRIFERFQQVDASATRQHEGTGIGLALVKEFCALMMGHVELESNLGQGACFKIFIPAIPTTQTSRPARDMQSLSLPHFSPPLRTTPALDSAPACEPKLEGEVCNPLILIAEDNEDLRDYIRDLLKDTYRVLCVGNGVLAFSAALKYNPSIVLSDVMMPEMDGLALTAAMKGDPRTAHIPLVLVTARAGAEASAEGLITGADDYIVKPFTDGELLARVKAAVRMRDMYDRILLQKEALEREIARREASEAERNAVQAQLLQASRQVGRAEVATSILHNAGNVLNSVGISVATLLSDDYAKPLPLLERIVNLIQKNRHDIATFFQTKQGELALDALGRLTGSFKSRQVFVDEEMTRIANQIETLIIILNKQNAFARVNSFLEEVDINAVVRSSVQLASLGEREAKTVLEEKYDETLPILLLDRQKVLQIMFNLIKNAFEATLNQVEIPPQIQVQTQGLDGMVMVTVSDNGHGIAEETMLRIFNSGFTTKSQGNGFGLHSSANLAKEMGGRLTAKSPGLNAGASFCLELPLSQDPTVA